MFCTSLTAQNIFVEAGKSTSRFEFENSQQKTLQNLHSTTSSYISIGYEQFIPYSKHISVQGSITHNSYGALGSDGLVNNYFEWDLDYLGFQLMFNFYILKKKNWDLFVRIGSSAEIMTRGVQKYNRQVLGLKNVEEFDNLLVFSRGGVGASHQISANTRLFFNYTYGISVPMLDKSPTSDESLKILNNQIGLGLIFNLNDKNCCSK